VDVLCFPLGLYIGTPIAYALNGILLRRLPVQNLYAAGMLLSGVAMLFLMRLHALTPPAILRAGVLMGIASGLFWSSRQFLVLSTTSDQNLNYYYGFELFFGTLASVVVPLLAGGFISATLHAGWLGGEPNRAYLIVAVVALLLSAAASLMVLRGTFAAPRIGRFLYWNFHPLWRRMLLLAGFKGLAQGYMLAMPAILVMLLVGHEGTLGIIESAGGLISAFLLYYVGRRSAPGHRGAVFAAGLALFAFGSLLNACFFNVAGVLGFQLCLVLAKPMLDLAYWPIELQAVDRESARTGRDRYAYLMSHETGIFFARCAGCGLMIVMALRFSPTDALRFAMPIVALIQMLSIPVYAWLRRGVAAYASCAGD
jgi:YQGE family putative transporter